VSAPANDNFANATALSAASGSLSDTTVSATSETGEPGHPKYNPCPSYPVANSTVGPYNTVWYQWTCPTSGNYYFTTRGQDAFGVPITSFKSTVQIFVTNHGIVPEVVTDLLLIQQVPVSGSPWGFGLTSIVLYDQSVGAAGGLDNGASIAFTATAGTIYYIQIDTRATGATGTFTLKWGAFAGLTIGDCGSAMNFNANVECFGTVQISDLTTNNFYSFGTIAAAPGNYAVMLVSGDPTLVNDYSGSTNPAAGVVDGNILACSEWPSGSVWSCDTIFDLPASVCAMTIIPHHTSSQPIGIACLGNSSATNSSKNPTYTLVYYPFTISALSNSQGWNYLYNASGATATSGTSWQAKFNIVNLSTADFDGTTVTLLATGGISSPSGAQTIDLAASASSSTGMFTFTADPTAGLVTATLQFARNGFTVGTLSYPLYPIYSITVTPNESEANCASTGGTYTGKYWVTKIVCTPIWPPGGSPAYGGALDGWGYFNVISQNPNTSGAVGRNQIVFTITNSAGVNLYFYDATGGPAYNPLACDPLSSIAEYTFEASGIGYPTTIQFGLQAGSSPQSVPITLAMQLQVSATAFVSLPSYTQTITVPAA